MDLKDDLKQFAWSIGIDHLGVAPASPFPAEQALLEGLAAKGAYPPFTERDVALRCNPQRVLAGARSIISIAVSYLAHHARMQAPQGPRGWVSRYARGPDYHSIMSGLLEQLASFLRERVGRKLRCHPYVDTGPLLDRAVATRAGLGWFGKNSMVYVPTHGSWVFLAELVTDLDLEPDPPTIGPRCQDCDLCMRACPTGAIDAPYRVDARRCLSYISQMPGQVPREWRRALGRRIWGCDVCQAACPWNKTARPGRLQGAWRSGEAAAPNLVTLLGMSKKQFRELFGGTAMAWRGKNTLQRNAAIALGNSGDEQAVPAIAERLLHDPKPVLRGACAWALGELGGGAARQALLMAQRAENAPEVQEEITWALKSPASTPSTHPRTRGELRPAPP